MSMSSQDKLRQIWMFFGMAKDAQCLDVVWIRSTGKITGMRIDVMPLKFFFAPAFFTLFAFCQNIFNSFSARVCAFTRSVVPKWMIIFRHFSSSSICHALYRTILPSSSPAFANLKLFVALFTRTINHCFRFFWFNFISAFSGASVCLSSVMSFEYLKLFITRRAIKSYFSSTFNFSRSICHG